MFTIHEVSKMMELYRKGIIEEKLEGLRPFLPMGNIIIEYEIQRD